MASGSPVKQRLFEFYETISDDLDTCVQFWLKHSHDEEHGGFFQCLDAEGKLYDSSKMTWMLCRQVWTYARLYQEVQRYHQPHMLEAAKKGAEFIMKHVKMADSEKCYLLLTREGKPIKSQKTIFSETFYVMAMAEMYRVTKEESYKKEALTMMQSIIHWVKVDSSGLGETIPDPEPTIPLGYPMMLLCVIDVLEDMEPEHSASFSDLAHWCVAETKKHIQRNGTVVLENVTEEGLEVEGSKGRLMSPGHAIEAGWFLLKRSLKTGDQDLQSLAIETFIEKPFEMGWDKEFGGLFYFMDVDSRPPLQFDWDMKFFWPHNEAMIAFLVAYKVTGEAKHLEKFAQVFDYAYHHFVDHHHGEWFGHLDRQGKVKIHSKGGHWKGCFHVPRCLMMCEQMLHEILQTKS